MSQLKTQVADLTGQQARLEELYLRNVPGALTTAYFLAGNRDLAEDLVQDSFIRVTGRFGHLRSPDAFPGYLRRTMVNLFTSQLRRRALERDWVQTSLGGFRAGHESSSRRAVSYRTHS